MLFFSDKIEEIESKRFFSLEPFQQKSLLTVSTMPRSKWFGLASTFDANEFLEIARAVAATI
jgi:hypothetical protein